jgi:hypothetical protein
MATGCKPPSVEVVGWRPSHQDRENGKLCIWLPTRFAYFAAAAALTGSRRPRRSGTRRFGGCQPGKMLAVLELLTLSEAVCYSPDI